MTANLPEVDLRTSLLISPIFTCILPLGLFLVNLDLFSIVHSVLYTVYIVVYLYFAVCLFDIYYWQSL